MEAMEQTGVTGASASPDFLVVFDRLLAAGWTRQCDGCWRTPDDRVVCGDEAVEYASRLVRLENGG